MLNLNPEQREAIEHGEGPLLVVAGPGSGKTRVITQRVVYLLEHGQGTRPENILAVTFTDKAAEEMKRRVMEALPGLEAVPHISTFHAFCYHVLRERHFERRLLDKVDVWIFLRRRMEHLGLDFYQKLPEPGAFLHDLNEFFSRCQDELIEPEDFEAYVAKVEKDFEQRVAKLDPAARTLDEEEMRKTKELARVFRNSRRLIEQAGSSSLGSLISEAVRLFDREPEVLEKYRARFRYVLVDEFQDTNYAQVELLKRLVAPPYNVTAVGDDDQAIYRFRGAAHGAFEMFWKAFGKGKPVYLNRNYRSTPRILRCADVVIARNDRERGKPPLRTEKADGASVYLLEAPDYASEAAWIADEVERLRGELKALADIAILYRAHSYRDVLVREFRRRRIPFAIRGLSVLSTVILRDLMAYLNLVHSPHHNISLTRVLLAPRWRFPEELALEIRKEASKHRCSLYDALEAKEQTLFRDGIADIGWPELKALLTKLRHSTARVPVSGLFDQLMSRLGLTFLPGDRDAEHVNAFRKFLEGWEEKSETRRLREFMEYFAYFLDAGGKIEVPEPDDPGDAVQMMTVHAAKGLEFPVVFVLSVAPRRFPAVERKPVIVFPDELRKGPKPPRNIHTQEERRLFFVALTRAKDRLYVSSVTKPGKKPSALIEDLLSSPTVAGHDIERIQVSEVPPEEALVAPPTRLAFSEPAMRGDSQPGLFSEVAARPGTVYPELSGWTSSPPALESEGKLHLSATAVETYLGCPLKFKFSHYLKIPTGPQPALTFGNIMHQAVRHYFELRKSGVPAPSFDQIEKFYLEAWRDAGFEDNYQEQAYKKAGLEQLREFAERQNQTVLRAENVRAEESFQLDLGDIVLEGRIDQINALGPPGDHTVELVDYKTGRPRVQRDADESLQLSIYALAAREQLKLNPARLTFYNLTNNQAVSTARTGKDLEQALEEIREVAAQIRSLLFAPTPGFACKWCDFVPICPAHEEF